MFHLSPLLRAGIGLSLGVLVVAGLMSCGKKDAPPPAAQGNQPDGRLPAAPTPATAPDSVPNKATSDKAAQGKTLTLDVGGGVTMELVKIEAGVFLMGSPDTEAKRDDDETQHEVKIEKAFYMGVYEVTQAQYTAIIGENPSHFRGSDDLPVELVTWDDAREFCRKLSEKVGRKVRLPTEAEWEYACRAGTTTPFAFGNDLSTAEVNYNGHYAYANDGRGIYRAKTVPVGSLKKPNEWGLHDMHGNVWEWCSSKYMDYPYKSDDGREDAGVKAARVLRGGSWGYTPSGCRSAYRDRGATDRRSMLDGFRVVVDLAD